MSSKLLTACLSFALLAGCSASGSSEEEVAVAINDTCPIMGGAVEDDGGRTEFHGETIGFCCPGCVGDFEELDEQEKVAALSDVGVDV